MCYFNFYLPWPTCRFVRFLPLQIWNPARGWAETPHVTLYTVNIFKFSQGDAESESFRISRTCITLALQSFYMVSISQIKSLLIYLIKCQRSLFTWTSWCDITTTDANSSFAPDPTPGKSRGLCVSSHLIPHQTGSWVCVCLVIWSHTRQVQESVCV
jgi:hypothetical protein